MLPVEIYGEILGYLGYAEQGPLRCTCRAIYRLPVSPERACELPTVPEIIDFLSKAVCIEARRQIFERSSSALFLEPEFIYFINGTERAAIEYEHETGAMYFSMKVFVKFKSGYLRIYERTPGTNSMDEIRSRLSGYRFRLHNKISNWRLYRVICQRRTSSVNVNAFLISLIQIQIRLRLPDYQIHQWVLICLLMLKSDVQSRICDLISMKFFKTTGMNAVALASNVGVIQSFLPGVRPSHMCLYLDQLVSDLTPDELASR